MPYLIDLKKLTAPLDEYSFLHSHAGDIALIAIAERLETIADALNDLSNTVEAIHHDIRSK